MSAPPVPRGGVARPALGWFVVLDGGVVVLATLVASPRAYDVAASRVPLPRHRLLRGLLAATVVIHAAEALAAWRVARGRGLDARGWALQTLVVGFPSLRALGRAA